MFIDSKLWLLYEWKYRLRSILRFFIQTSQHNVWVFKIKYCDVIALKEKSKQVYGAWGFYDFVCVKIWIETITDVAAVLVKHCMYEYENIIVTRILRNIYFEIYLEKTKVFSHILNIKRVGSKRGSALNISRVATTCCF